jgi:hypothetical protein
MHFEYCRSVKVLGQRPSVMSVCYFVLCSFYAPIETIVSPMFLHLVRSLENIISVFSAPVKKGRLLFPAEKAVSAPLKKTNPKLFYPPLNASK